MIYFVVKDAVRWGIEDYLAGYGEAMASRVGIITYEELPHMREFPEATYIFTQWDALLPAELEMVTVIWRELEKAPSVRLLNDPRRILGRYDLIRTLHDQGLNDYSAVRATEDASHLRFPLFIREERNHTGSLTALLHTRAELDRAMGNLLLRGWRRRNLLVVEFWDTRNEQGFYRKFSAYVVGGEIIARTVLFSRHWMVKAETKTMDEDVVRKELEFVQTNPHAEWLRRVFSTAGIEYGRIDYGLLGERPQVWEINLYPTLVRPSWKPPSASPEERALREPARTIFFQRFQSALEKIDGEASPGRPVPVHPGNDILRRLRRERWLEGIRTLHHRAFRRASRVKVLHPVWRFLSPAGTRISAAVARLGRTRRD